MKIAHRHTPPRLLAVFFAATLLLGTATPNSAFGAEAPARPQATAFYRITVGDFAVTALSDGAAKRPAEQQLQLLYGDKEKITAALRRAYPDGQIPTAVNAYLIDTGAKLMLIDAGNGRMGSPAMGQMIDNLRAAGYRPEDVDEIYLTHMHGDHVGGLVAETGRAFPQATVYAAKAEAEYWLNDSNLDAAPDAAKRSFQAAKTALAPYIAAGKFQTFAGGGPLTPGIRAEALPGHTPGHTAYFIESKGRTLLLWGDIVHVAAVQFADPAVTIAYDSDRAVAAATRQQILAAAAQNGWLIGGAHILFPGFGRVRADGNGGYVFQPLDE